MKFDQLIEYNQINILHKNHAKNVARRLVLDLFLLFKKALHDVKARDLDCKLLSCHVRISELVYTL